MNNRFNRASILGFFAFSAMAATAASQAKADLLSLPEVGQTKEFTRSYSPAHMANHPGQRLKSISLTIYNVDEGEEQGFSAAIQGVTREGKYVTGESGHCDELPSSLGLVCSLVDSEGGDIMITDSRQASMISLNFRDQNGKATSLQDALYRSVPIPADRENSTYLVKTR